MPRRRRPPPIPDPLLPLGLKTQRVRAQKNVLSQTRPQIRELSRVLTQEAAAGTRNITGVTNQLAQSLAGGEQKVGDIYGAARQQLAGINTEAANRLAASGQQGADALRSSLAAAGVPTQGADAIAATGRGAAAAGFATGAAELAQLVSGEAAGRTYAAAQPGIARLGGLQGVRELQARKQQELSKGVGAIQAQVPGLIRQEQGELRQGEYQKAVALRGFGLDAAKLQAEAASDRAAIAAKGRQARLGRQATARQKALDRQAKARDNAADRAADIAKAQAKYAASAKTREDEQRFKSRLDAAKRKFQARQNRLNRRAYGGKSKKGKEKSASGL